MSSKKMRIAMNVAKDCLKSRTDQGKVVATVAPKSPLYIAVPALQDAGVAVVNAGAAVSAAEAAVSAAENALATARGIRDTKVVEFDAAYGVYVALAEKSCATPEDVTGLGLPVLDKGAYPLAAPIGVQARFDILRRLLCIRVKHAPGMRSCVIEISTDPADPTAWKRLNGVGAVHALKGYAPGMYWVRAASVRANEQSDFTTPIPVIVK